MDGENESVGRHISVLKEEVIEGLAIKKGDIILDGTVNGGGHSSEIAKRFGQSVKIIGIDADKNALERARKNIPGNPTLVEENFRNLDKVLSKENIEKVDRVLLDLGLSSDQLGNSGRGFSFMKDEPLRMTFKSFSEKEETIAYDVVNHWEEKNLESVIRGFGEERNALKIASAILRAREKSPIKTSGQLAEIVERAVPRRGKIHPSTKTFQAIRMAVNDELGALQEVLPKAFDKLNKGGRIAIISFHSLEDRAVKIFMREKAKEGVGRLINKKPITPSKEEILKNPRSRSAKLRIIEKI